MPRSAKVAVSIAGLWVLSPIDLIKAIKPPQLLKDPGWARRPRHAKPRNAPFHVTQTIRGW